MGFSRPEFWRGTIPFSMGSLGSSRDLFYSWLLHLQAGSLWLSYQGSHKIWSVVKLNMVFTYFFTLHVLAKFLSQSPQITFSVVELESPCIWPKRQAYRTAALSCLSSPPGDLGVEHLLRLPETSNHSSRDMSPLAAQGWPILWPTHLFGVPGRTPPILASQGAPLSTSFFLFQFSSVTQSGLTLCDPANHSTQGLPVHHQLPEFAQTHVHWVGDAIKPSHPLPTHFPPAVNLSQHQSLFKWVSTSHQVAKVLEFQLQHQSYQWTPRTDLL